MSATEKYLDESFITVLKIASNIPPEITAVFLYDLYRENADRVVACGGLKEAPYLQEILIFEGNKSVYKDVESVDGVPSYLSRYGRWVEVDVFNLRVYTVCLDWLLKRILYGLGASVEHRYNSILDDYIWNFGNIYLKQHKIPVIVARCITEKEVYRALVQYLNNHHIKIPALVLSMESHLPEYFSLPVQNVCFIMEDILINDMEKVYFNIDLILEKMGKDIKQEGFTNGYRSGFFNGVSYTFTKKRAEILELLDNAKKPMHQDEILAIVSPNSSNTKINSIFRSNGRYHSAWDVIIKHDSKGNYWLEY